MSDTYFKYELEGDGYKIIEYNGQEYELYIPSEHEGIPVVRLADELFYGNSELGMVHIPGSIKQISAGCFGSCEHLASAFLGEGIISIASGAFRECINLSMIDIPNSVTNIGEDAFSSSNLETITLGKSVTTIGGYAFYQCYRLGSIDIPNSVTTIGDSAFEYSSLKSITLGKNIKTIGKYAFNNCDALLNLNYTGTIDDWAQIDFSNAYSNPTYYTCDLKINNNSITQVELTNATKVSAYAFYNCERITDVTLNQGIESIGTYAFKGCSRLTSLIIPKSVATIGERIIWDCINLSAIFCEAAAKPDSWNAKWYDEDGEATIYWYSEDEPTSGDTGNYWHYEIENGFKISCDPSERMIDSKYFKVDQDGKIEAIEGNFVNANIGSGKIAQFTIEGDSLIASQIAEVEDEGSISNNTAPKKSYYQTILKPNELKCMKSDASGSSWLLRPEAMNVQYIESGSAKSSGLRLRGYQKSTDITNPSNVNQASGIVTAATSTTLTPITVTVSNSKKLYSKLKEIAPIKLISGELFHFARDTSSGNYTVHTGNVDIGLTTHASSITYDKFSSDYGLSFSTVPQTFTIDSSKLTPKYNFNKFDYIGTIEPTTNNGAVSIGSYYERNPYSLVYNKLIDKNIYLEFPNYTKGILHYNSKLATESGYTSGDWVIRDDATGREASIVKVFKPSLRRTDVTIPSMWVSWSFQGLENGGTKTFTQKDHGFSNVLFATISMITIGTESDMQYAPAITWNANGTVTVRFNDKDSTTRYFKVAVFGNNG